MEDLITLGKRVRPSIVDGLFYPEEAADVLAYMQSMKLKRGKSGFPAAGGRAKAIIAPHGAWDLSGTLAAAAFASAGGRTGFKSPSRVVIMGPIHDDREEGLFLTSSHSFLTPLGSIPVDQEACGWIESYNPLFKVDDIPHLHEHSIEVLLPFVKYCFPRAAIVPILLGLPASMGQPQERHIDVLAHALRAVFEPVMKDTLLVVSFNLAMHSGETTALDMANEYVRLFKEGRYGELSLSLKDGRITSCGGALVSALLQSGLMDASRPCVASDLLLRAWGEHEKTVYYGAFAFE